MVIQLRIDERLTHGQVCTTWINTLGASHVIIANDAVANDSFQKGIMALGIPDNVKSIFSTLEKAAGMLNDPRSANLKIFIVTKTPQDAKYLCDHVQDIKEINLANYGTLVKPDVKGKRKLSDFVTLDDADSACVKELKEQVGNMYIQDIVGKSKTNIKL